MLSSMETPLGLTVIGPKGTPLRIMRSMPCFAASKALLKEGLPAEQLWQRLQDLLVSPFMAVIHWAERHGLAITEADDTFKIGDRQFDKVRWLPLVDRLMKVGASAEVLPMVHDLLAEAVDQVPVGDLCLHWHETPFGPRLGLVERLVLPEEVKTGDLLKAPTRGLRRGPAYLVSFTTVALKEDLDGKPSIIGTEGLVIGKVLNEHWAEDVLKQPVILGYNRTYRVEEGGGDGWLEDTCTDSLMDARVIAKEIKDSGAEARIINRTSGDVVPA